jgi:predicted metal-dependent hydrolase
MEFSTEQRAVSREERLHSAKQMAEGEPREAKGVRREERKTTGRRDSIFLYCCHREERSDAATKGINY